MIQNWRENHHMHLGGRKKTWPIKTPSSFHASTVTSDASVQVHHHASSVSLELQGRSPKYSVEQMVEVYQDSHRGATVTSPDLSSSVGPRLLVVNYLSHYPYVTGWPAAQGWLHVFAPFSKCEWNIRRDMQWKWNTLWDLHFNIEKILV